MRILHRPVWEGMVRSLHEVFNEGRPADKVIQFHLRNGKKWGSQDRRLFAEGLYDVVRWWRKLLWLVDVAWPADDRWSGEDQRVHELVLEAWCALNDVELGKGLARRLPAGAPLKARWASKDIDRATRASIPDWLDRWGMEQLPDRWESLLEVLNTQAPVFLRANRLKTTPQKLVAALKAEQYEAELAGQDGVRLKKRANVFLSKSFHQGLFEVQDLHSQAVALELGVEPGMRVIDACSGAGGKSLHLAALMGNKGKILSLDVVQKKLDELRTRSTRAGADLIETRLIEGGKMLKRLEATADRVLLDVPCSGMGILRRNPDSKWKSRPDELERVGQLQRDILRDYSAFVKPGGVLVYATCSIMPSENIKVVEDFLSQNGTAFSLEKQQTLWPEKDGADGFFFARLRKS